MSLANLPGNLLSGIFSRLTDPYNKASLRLVSRTAANHLLPAQQNPFLRRMRMLLPKLLHYRGSKIEISSDTYPAQLEVQARAGMFSLRLYDHNGETVLEDEVSAGQVLRRISHIVSSYPDRSFRIIFDYERYRSRISKLRHFDDTQMRNLENFTDGAAAGASMFEAPNYNLHVAPWLQKLPPLAAPTPRVRNKRARVPTVEPSRVRRRLELAPTWDTPVLGHRQMLARLHN